MGEKKSLTTKMFPDPWRELRTNRFRNAEPSVEMIMMTQPVGKFKGTGITADTFPAYAAREAWESYHKYTGDNEKDTELDRELTRRVIIDRGHGTPLQGVQYNFDIRGVSKSLQAQWTRHKIGIGWVFRSTRFVPASGNKFVYCTYDYINDRDKVGELLDIDEAHAKQAIEDFDKKRSLGATKQDSRKVMPVEFATDCKFFVNARALRHLLDLRLAKGAEWEIRRLSAMILDEVMEHTPTLFEDIYERYFTKSE